MSSIFGAQFAAQLGLPYAFASHFAPLSLHDALHDYRTDFRPSRQLTTPYTAAGLNVFAAETDAEAHCLFTSAQQQFTNLMRGKPGKLPPPIDEIQSYWRSSEETHVSTMLTYSLVGSPATVASGFKRFLDQTGVDEVFAVSAIYDHAARLRSYEILADIFRQSF